MAKALPRRARRRYESNGTEQKSRRDAGATHGESLTSKEVSYI